MAASTESNEIIITRVYDAPVRAVWDAWTIPEQVEKWWGPRGFTLTHHSKELRPGGTWRYTMHGPDGTDYPNITTYFVVEEHKKLVYDHGATEDSPPLFRVTVTFEEVDGKTTMNMISRFATAAIAKEMAKFIKQAGGLGTWDRLGEHLGKTRENKELFLIARSFDVPIERMYDLWTDPQHFSQWLPPTGFTMEFLRADIREGGKTFYRMTNGAGVTMYGRAAYHELRRPHRIVYTQQFCDENENLSRHPMAPTWPATMLTTVTLSEEGPSRTRVKIQWEPYGETTAEEVATFVAARAGMTQGWGGSFEKLEAYLAL